MTLRILHIIDTAEWGGAERVVASEVKYAAIEQRHAIIVLNGKTAGPGDALPHTCDRLNVPFKFRNLNHHVKEITGFITQFEPNIINVNLQVSYLFYLFFLHRRFPEIAVNISIHALPAQIGIHWFILLAYMKRIVTGYTVEDSIALKTLHRFGVPESMIRLIPLGTDYFERERNETAPSPYDHTKGTVFLNIARMVPGKGQRFLLNAFAKYRINGGQGILYIVGYGPLEKQLMRQAVALGIDDSISFTGKVTDLTAYYRHADMFVSSSIDEGMGVVIYDAMASGLPIVGFDAGSLSEIVNNGVHGILVKNRHVRELSNAMGLLSNDRERRKRMGVQGRVLVNDKYRSSLMAASYATWFEALSRKTDHVQMAL